MPALDPAEVWTTTFPLTAPVGTVVTISVLVQSLGLAMGAATVSPPASANHTWLPPCVLPKLDPSMTTVLPEGPEGCVAPLMLRTTGGPPEGPDESPPQWTRSALDRTTTARRLKTRPDMLSS